MSAVNTIKEDIFQAQVVKAAQQLYQIYGLNKVTMEDVAKAVGKSKSALYYYYKSKEEIFDAVMENEINEIIAEIGAAVDDALTVDKKIYAFCIANLNISRKRRAFYNAMEAGMAADEISVYAKAKQAINQHIMKRKSDLLKKVFTEAVVDGEIPAQNAGELDSLIFVLLSALYGVKREMVIENELNFEPAVETLSRMVVRSLKA